MPLKFRAPLKYCVGQKWASTFSPDVLLNKENMQKTIAKFSTTKPIRMQPNEPARRAAVLVPLCVVDGRVSLLFTLRAASLKSHRGQVSFPGGMQDVHDKSLSATALRETREELGLRQEDIELWGTGTLIVTRYETSVLPVVGRIKKDLNINDLTINTDEVDEVFTVPIEDLCNSKNNGFTQFRGAYSAPVFGGSPRRIWGLTALITNAFLKALLPNKAYVHKINFIPDVQALSFKQSPRR